MFRESLIVVGKSETGLLPSSSGAGDDIGGREMFRSRWT